MTVERRPDRTSVTTGMGAALLGALMGPAAGGHPAAGGAVGATATPLLEWWLGKCVNEFRRRADVVATSAGRASRLGPDKAVERLLNDDDSQPLVVRVIEAATRTNSQEVLQ